MSDPLTENELSPEEKTNLLIGQIEKLVSVNEKQQNAAELIDLLLDEKLDLVVRKVERLFNKVDRLSDRVDDIADHVHGHSSGPSEDWDQRFENLQDKIVQSLEQQLLTASHPRLSSPFSHGSAGSDSSPGSPHSPESNSPFELPAVADENSLSDWERQKRRFLMDQGYQESFGENATGNVGQPNPEVSATGSVSIPEPMSNPMDLVEEVQEQEIEALHDSIENIEAGDSPEIDNLKELLSSKLRDAEVELSINRAKLSQQWAALEERQFELEKREAHLESRYGEVDDSTKKKMGILDRLSRHLSRNDGSKEQ